MRAAILVMLVAASASIASTARGDCPPSHHTGKHLIAAHGPIVLDGVLDDPTWRTACFARDFEQKQPVFGAPPTQPIEVAIALDADTLYVGARMYSRGTADIDTALTQRDDTAQAERFIISIDPAHTKRLAYSFAVTARGVRADWIHTDDSESRRDGSWNPVWDARAKLLPDGWSVEMAIPLSQLRLPRIPAASWGINFNWYIPHRQEDVFWRAVPPDRTAWASMFGELDDLPPVKPGLAIELLPYLASKLVLAEDIAAPLAHRWRAAVDAGLDVKLRPLPGLVLAGTVNPDFGQVEADPEFVNLTAYEVRLPEKRPFFVENNSLFANAGGNYFYSRRIGGLPLALPSSYDAIDLPPQVRILGAVAAGGYVAPQTQVAAIAAVTDQASADAIVNGVHAPIVVSPLTAWGAARIEQQLGASVIGATATFVRRALEATGLDGILVDTAAVGGADARLRTCDGTYELYGYAGYTALHGTPAAIRSIEEDSAHYMQRPDQSYMHVTTDADDLLGWHAGAIGRKREGAWRASLYGNFESPGFELNDLGALSSADDIDASADVRRYDTTPGDTVFGWNVGGGAGTSWDFGGLRKPVDVRASGGATLDSFDSGSLGAHFYTPGGSDDLTRGGPEMQLGWASAFSANASTPGGRANQLSGGFEVDVSPTLQQGAIASATLTTRVTPALRFDLTPSLVDIETHRQYVTTVSSAGGGDETFGARYLFGHLARKDAALQLRLTWSLSSDLVMTLWAQPFVSVGHYDQLGELAAAGGDQIRWYGQTAHVHGSRTIFDDTTFAIAEPDYRVASLRSTAVLRWELSPGSVLYLVWQQMRGGTSTPAAEPIHTAVPEVVTQAAIHTIAVKLSYWFG